MKKALFAAVLTVAIAMPAFAAESTAPPPKPQPNFAELKAATIQRIDKRIALSQEEKACVQAATSSADIVACREKVREQLKKERPRFKK